jgi:hypothetical protein
MGRDRQCLKLQTRPGHLIGAYTHDMRSVADDLRYELQEEVLRLPFEERIALGIRHALIGALALSAYGVNRATVDLDLFAADASWLRPDLRA